MYIVCYLCKTADIVLYVSNTNFLRDNKVYLILFNNDKPWFSTKLKQLRLAKEDAYRSGEKTLYKQAKYTLNREIRVAKKNYAGKLKK